MQPAISVRNVTKVYHDAGAGVTALNGVSLDVHPGEVVLMMGPSGSGKTTLLSIMGCILRATSGSVKINGEEVSHLPEKELPRVRMDNIGFVFQGFNLFPTLTAGENVELMLDIKGIRGNEAHERAKALLRLVGVEEKYASFPSDLSGGQKQRVAIARALAGEPNIILADEPTAALDSHTGHNVMQMLRGLAHDRGTAVVIVTHDPRILEFADRSVRIEDGLVAAQPETVPGVSPLPNVGGSELKEVHHE